MTTVDLSIDRNIGSEATRTMARSPIETTISTARSLRRRGVLVGYM
jgi:hypothetical protein